MSFTIPASVALAVVVVDVGGVVVVLVFSSSHSATEGESGPVRTVQQIGDTLQVTEEEHLCSLWSTRSCASHIISLPHNLPMLPIHLTLCTKNAEL